MEPVILFTVLLVFYALKNVGKISNAIKRLESDLTSYTLGSVRVRDFEKLLERVMALEVNTAEFRQQLKSMSPVEKETLTISSPLQEESELEAAPEPPPYVELARPSITLELEQVSQASPLLQSSPIAEAEAPPTVGTNVPATPPPPRVGSPYASLSLLNRRPFPRRSSQATREKRNKLPHHPFPRLSHQRKKYPHRRPFPRPCRRKLRSSDLLLKDQ